jgi:signal transduction histidine kinase
MKRSDPPVSPPDTSLSPSIHMAILLPFLLQTLGMIGLVGYLSFRSGNQAVDELANQVMSEVSDRVTDHLDHYVDAPPTATTLNLDQLKNGNLKVENLSQWQGDLFQQSRALPELSYIYYGSAQGDYVEYRQFGKTAFKVSQKSNAESNALSSTKSTGESTDKSTVEVFELNRLGQRGKLERTVPFDPRQRPWYKSASNNRAPHWTPIYLFTDSPETLGISLVQAHEGDKKQILGVVGADFALLSTTQFLGQLQGLGKGKAFIVERNGDLVASSAQQAPFQTDTKERIRASQFSDPLIRQTAEHIESQHGGWDQLKNQAQSPGHQPARNQPPGHQRPGHPPSTHQASTQFSFTADGTRQLVKLSEFQDQYGLDWLIVVVLPETEFMGQIYANRDRTFAICLGGMGLSLLTSWLIARWLSRPIESMSQAALTIAQGNLDRQVHVQGSRELKTLAHSFNRMSQALVKAQGDLRTYATGLEAQVQQRTQALAAKNENLTQTLATLQTTQAQLIRSEKIAVLGKLVASVAHEMNSPLGAIRSSVDNIHQILAGNLQELLQFLEQLAPEQRHRFYQLLHQAQTAQPRLAQLSSRDRRQRRRELQQQLTAVGVNNAETLADRLLDIGLSQVDAVLPLLQDPEHPGLLSALYELISLDRSIHTIATSTDRASRVVTALKHYANPVNSDRHQRPYDLREELENTLLLYHNLIKRGVEVEKHYQDPTTLVCYGDELNSVWSNLIHNALQAMQCEGKLTLAIQPSPEVMSVIVADNGPGIASDVQAQIFEPFFTTKPIGEGNGLGLNISRQIVERQGGSLTFTSQPGYTAFTVTLPRTPAPEPQPAAKE